MKLYTKMDLHSLPVTLAVVPEALMGWGRWSALSLLAVAVWGWGRWLDLSLLVVAHEGVRYRLGVAVGVGARAERA